MDNDDAEYFTCSWCHGELRSTGTVAHNGNEADAPRHRFCDDCYPTLLAMAKERGLA